MVVFKEMIEEEEADDEDALTMMVMTITVTTNEKRFSSHHWHLSLACRFDDGGGGRGGGGGGGGSRRDMIEIAQKHRAHDLRRRKHDIRQSTFDNRLSDNRWGRPREPLYNPEEGNHRDASIIEDLPDGRFRPHLGTVGDRNPDKTTARI